MLLLWFVKVFTLISQTIWAKFKTRSDWLTDWQTRQSNDETWARKISCTQLLWMARKFGKGWPTCSVMICYAPTTFSWQQTKGKEKKPKQLHQNWSVMRPNFLLATKGAGVHRRRRRKDIWWTLQKVHPSLAAVHQTLTEKNLDNFQR